MLNIKTSAVLPTVAVLADAGLTVVVVIVVVMTVLTVVVVAVVVRGYTN